MLENRKEEKLKIKEYTKNEDGITLIALVVTIIVLLILAGVTISLVVGQNGIITRANSAKEETRGASVEEQVAIWKLDKEAEKYMTTGKVESREKIIQRLYDQKLLTRDEYTKLNENPKLIITIGSKQIDFTEEAGDTPSDSIGKVEVNIPATENSTINGEKGAYNNPIIPKGFKAIETAQDNTITAEASWTSSTGWQNGLVIEDATGDTTTNGSQFVWVPVEKYDNFHLIEGYCEESLQSRLSEATDPVREAGASLTAKLPGKPKEANTLLGTKESVAMYRSVKDNGGFYIARYEMGLLGTTASTLTNDSNKQTQDGSIKPVSKAGVGVWNVIPWGGTTAKEATDGEQGNDKANGAVKVARKMYNNPIEGNNNTNTSVKSTLIYGVQWDAVMNFIDSNYLTGTCEDSSFVKNSTDKGNYTVRIATTGSNQTYQQKNIYDLGGNVYEWTMEAYNSNSRVYRGLIYGTAGSFSPASNRDYLAPGSLDSHMRVSLSTLLVGLCADKTKRRRGQKLS